MSTVNLGSSPEKNEGGPNSTRQLVNPRCNPIKLDYSAAYLAS